MREQQVAQLMTVPPGGFHRVHQPTSLGVVTEVIERRRGIVLLIYCKGESQDDAISFLTRHCYMGSLNKMGGGTKLEEHRHPQCGIADRIRV